MNPTEAQMQDAMRFLRALPGLAERGELPPGEAARLTLPSLAALAQRHGYAVEADALAEAFRIRMLARLVAQRREKK